MNAVVVNVDGAELFSAPKGYAVATIPEHTVIKVINWEFRKEWAQVEYKGRLGCVQKNSLAQTSQDVTEDEKKEEFKPVDVESMPLSERFSAESSFHHATGLDRQYVVIQVTLKEAFIGTGSKNLTELEDVINAQAAKGYRLHTISTASATSRGVLRGDRIQATMVFEKI